MAAFKAHDPKGRGVIGSQDLYRVLTQFGEKLPRAEGIKCLYKTPLYSFKCAILILTRAALCSVNASFPGMQECV